MEEKHFPITKQNPRVIRKRNEGLIVFPKGDTSGSAGQQLVRGEFLLGFSHMNCLKHTVSPEAKSLFKKQKATLQHPIVQQNI